MIDNYIHEKLSAIVGAATSMIVSETNSVLERIFIGAAVGILVWIGTRTLTWLKEIIFNRIEKLEKKIQKLDGKMESKVETAVAVAVEAKVEELK